MQNTDRRKVNNFVADQETVDIDRLSAYQHLLNYKPKIGISHSIMHENKEMAVSYFSNTIRNKNDRTY